MENRLAFKKLETLTKRQSEEVEPGSNPPEEVPGINAVPALTTNNIMNSRIAEFDVPISVLTPDGKGNAIAWLDFGKDSLWIVHLRSKGECWIYANTEIQVEKIAHGLTAQLSEAIKNTSLTIHQPVAACPAYREALRWFKRCAGLSHAP